MDHNLEVSLAELKTLFSELEALDPDCLALVAQNANLNASICATRASLVGHIQRAKKKKETLEKAKKEDLEKTKILSAFFSERVISSPSFSISATEVYSDYEIYVDTLPLKGKLPPLCPMKFWQFLSSKGVKKHKGHGAIVYDGISLRESTFPDMGDYEVVNAAEFFDQCYARTHQEPDRYSSPLNGYTKGIWKKFVAQVPAWVGKEITALTSKLSPIPRDKIEEGVKISELWSKHFSTSKPTSPLPFRFAPELAYGLENLWIIIEKETKIDLLGFSGWGIEARALLK